MGIIGPSSQPKWQYSPLPNGVDDTAPIQAWLNRNAGARCIWRSVGGSPYILKEPINVPVESFVEGENPESLEINRVGNGDIFRLGGGSNIRNLGLVRATAKQANGAAFDFSHFNANNVWIENVKLGDRLFNGFNCIAEAALPEIGGIHLKEIHFTDTAHAVKEWGNAGFVLGSTAKRLVAVYIDDVHMQVNAVADMPNGFLINNCDSLHIAKVLVQNAANGFVTGNEDLSAKRTTNLFVNDLQCDGCTIGISLASLLEESNMVACHAEACGVGMVWGEAVSGLAFADGSIYHNSSHGLTILGSVSPEFGNTLIGNHFHSNGENAEAGRAGITIGASAGGLIIADNSIGNPLLIGGGKQKLGIQIGAKAKNIRIANNRIFKNVTANYEVGAETTNVPTLAEVEANNLMV
jgi:hypothetical protein